MKHINPFLKYFFCCFVSLSIAVSCERAIDRQLDEAEQVLAVQPQEAFNKLSAVDPGGIHRESRRARYALLLSLARDKSYIDVANDSLIQTAVKYYKSHGSLSDRMLAWYSLGRVQRNAGNNTGAIISFLQAKELAEVIPDKHYYGLATKNMAELYAAVHDYDTELYYYQESSKAFLETGEPYYRAYSMLGEARAEMARGKYELADSLLISLEEYAKAETHTSLLASVLKTRALTYMNQEREEPDKVILFSREAQQMGFPPEYVDGFGTLAMAFEFLHQEDSVNYYLSLAEECTKTLTDSIQLCNTKYGLFDYKKQYLEANRQLEKGVALHNRLVFNRENQQIANSISAFSRQEAIQQALVSHHRLELLLLSSVTILALLGAIVMILLNRRRQIREKDKKIEEDLAQILEITEELQEVRANHSEMAKAINDLIAEKIAVVKMCADAYEEVKNAPKENPRDPYRYLDEDPIQKKTEEMQHFLLALDNFRKDDSLFAVLEDSVNKWRDNIMHKLRCDYSKESMGKAGFTEDDFKMLMLFYAGIPDRTIAFLMDMTCVAVRTRKSRYKERFAQKDCPGGAYYLQVLASFPDKKPLVTSGKKQVIE